MPSHTLDHFENLIVDRQGAVAIVTVRRPRVLNALSAQRLDELRRAILPFRHDADVRVVVVTGAGDQAFVAVTGH